jgi:hypothetical protein
LIFDGILGPGPGPRYRVVTIDGEPVKRARSSIHTVIPCAIVEPGTHTLVLETGDEEGNDPQTRTVSASFEAGKHYTIASEDGDVTVVENTD